MSDAPTSQRRSPSVFLSPRQTPVHALIRLSHRRNQRLLTRAPIHLLLLWPHLQHHLHPLLHPPRLLHLLHLHHLSPQLHPPHRLSLLHRLHLPHRRTTVTTLPSMALPAKLWLSLLPSSAHNRTITQTVRSAQSPLAPFLNYDTTEFGDCDGPNLNGKIAHVPCPCPPLRDAFITVSW